MVRVENIKGALEVQLREEDDLFRSMARSTTIAKMGDEAKGTA